ncbi:MAG: carbohydrate kinase [Rhodobacteraceae bacterium]|jgi:fructokinase|uniref:carbohydrate kinase family protein n=1 Tax=Albidovulum sp. TaxID=1872424 RepID=UPI001DE0AFD3|nr:carbohydrate kinase [uncultured Defluviimonas sp.]MCB2126901.1 carbohydrate kinase [Paracoccaceae bacterium]MCC0068937.1 carbohydrate kinase [Paracoccaceae bacterium]
MILSCGEALIDMLPRRTEGGEDAFAPYPGGAVFNTAIALGRLGAPSGFLSGVSTDLFGQLLTAALAASGVDTAFLVRSARPTTLAFVTLRDGQASYAFYDENTAGRMIRPGDLPTLPETVEALFFGGISLMVEPGGATYQALMEREAGSGRVMMLDPNIRPSFIADEAAYRARIGRMIALSDIVKLSDEDLRWLVGGHGIAAGAEALLAKGPKAVFVTEGAAGAHAFTAAHSIFVPARRVEVADTVGAGDTFNAGVLAALRAAGVLTKAGIAALPEDALRAALSLGTRAAAVTVSRAGANPPWARDLA